MPDHPCRLLFGLAQAEAQRVYGPADAAVRIAIHCRSGTIGLTVPLDTAPVTIGTAGISVESSPRLTIESLMAALKPEGPPLEILQVLLASGRAMTTSEMLTELSRRNYTSSENTVKNALAAMVALGLLVSNEHGGRGYQIRPELR